MARVFTAGVGDSLQASSGKLQRVWRMAVPAAVAFLFLGLGFVMWWTLRSPLRVVGVHAGARLVAVSNGAIYWLGRTCSVWRAPLEGAHAAEPLEPLLYLAECPLDDPRVAGDVLYHLSGQGRITRHASGARGRVMLERALAYSLALDTRYLYVGNCALSANCQIERLPAENDPGDPILMQAGILALANMDVDQREIFWVDRGRRRPDCAQEPGVDAQNPTRRCKEPVPPRLMAASKDEPRAIERVVMNDFDGRRPFLAARHVYWLGAGGVRCVAKSGLTSEEMSGAIKSASTTGGATGGANQLVLATRTMSGFAADGDEVFVAADAGIFRGRDGDALRSFQATASAPRGVAIDGSYVYWIDADANAVVRRRR